MHFQKYRSNKCTWNGQRFDSELERDRYAQLILMQKAGKIRELHRQVRFQLIPAQKDSEGKAIERPVFYVADFTYREPYDGAPLIVEDTKGVKTKDYIIKRKLMLYTHGIRIREITRDDI